MEAPELKGIEGEKLTIDQREILESKGAIFAGDGNKLPTRMFIGLRIQTLIDQDAIQSLEKRWGVLWSQEGQLILSDRPLRLMSITASPRLLLAADNPDGDLTQAEVYHTNGISIARSRNYVVVPPR